MLKKVFIDGEEGTTGLQIYERLKKHPNIEVIKIDPNKRKNLLEKKEMMKKADLVFLCLPDVASREAVSIGEELEEDCPIFIDASTAHRTSAMWSYGLPELSDEYRNNINKSNLIAVPGCYATGSNLIIFPLTKMGLISCSHQFIIQAVSGFSGIAAQRYMAPSDSPTTIIGAADVYMSDFGTLQVVPNRFSRERDAYLVDPDMVELVTLRDMAVTELAKTGDSSKFMTLVEYGLQVNNEAGLGVAADLTTS
mgnify:CR=1 FL=1